MVEKRSSSELTEEWETVDPRNCRGITITSTVGKPFLKILNDKIGTIGMKGEMKSEGQAE